MNACRSKGVIRATPFDFSSTRYQPDALALLAASYATERKLTLTVLVPDFHHFPAAAERRDDYLVEQADAAVVVWDDRDLAVRRVLALVERKGVPVHVIGAPAKHIRDPEEPSRRGELPD